LALAGCAQESNQAPAPTQAPPPPPPKSPASDPPAESRSAALAPAAATPEAAAPTDLPRLARVEVGTTTPAHQFGNYYLAGQPSEADLALWKERGVRTIISLRTPGEIDWDEKAAAEALGLKFVSIPFRGADSLGDRQIEEALAALEAGEREGVLLHCATSNRVGAIWYAHRIRRDGLSPEAALAEAKTAGLRSTALSDVVNEYCERVAASK
jgi:protein tyrosine phosphatase (PTP) superfamily phosphohydrolase (DUF442 family)